MAESFDCVVVGGGAVGTSCAYHLARNGFRGSLLLLDREEALGMGTTGRSVGGVRHQFPEEWNVRLSLMSGRELKAFGEELGRDAGFKERGYLLMASKDETLSRLRRNMQLQRKLGVPVEELSPKEIRERIPPVNAGGVMGGSFCPWDGHADPGSVVEGYGNGARALGAEVRLEAEATGVELRGRKISGLRWVPREGGEERLIRTPLIINAAGPWAGLLAGTAGLRLPVKPYRGQVFVSNPVGELPLPLVGDLERELFFRPEGERIIWVRKFRDEPEGFETRKFTLSDRQYIIALTEMSERLPLVHAVDDRLSWAGLYCETADLSSILGFAPGLEGFINACGHSGHGFMHSPALGQLVSELVIDGKTSSLDITPLRLERFFEPGAGRMEKRFV